MISHEGLIPSPLEIFQGQMIPQIEVDYSEEQVHIHGTLSSVSGIDQQGLHPALEKVRAMQEAPQPRCVAELKSYLGLLTFI